MGGSSRHRRQSKRKRKGTKRAKATLVRRELDRVKPFLTDVEATETE
jgi:hypothetical protein